MDETGGERCEQWKVRHWVSAFSVRVGADLLQDLPGIRNGWAWTVKPLLLSLIHVTQDNWHRSWGATVGDTEEEARSWRWDGGLGRRDGGAWTHQCFCSVETSQSEPWCMGAFFQCMPPQRHSYNLFLHTFVCMFIYMYMYSYAWVWMVVCLSVALHGAGDLIRVSLCLHPMTAGIGFSGTLLPWAQEQGRK